MRSAYSARMSRVGCTDGHVDISVPLAGRETVFAHRITRRTESLPVSDDMQQHACVAVVWAFDEKHLPVSEQHTRMAARAVVHHYDLRRGNGVWGTAEGAVVDDCSLTLGTAVYPCRSDCVVYFVGSYAWLNGSTANKSAERFPRTGSVHLLGCFLLLAVGHLVHGAENTQCRIIFMVAYYHLFAERRVLDTVWPH
jgi:hypothetical protein